TMRPALLRGSDTQSAAVLVEQVSERLGVHQHMTRWWCVEDLIAPDADPPNTEPHADRDDVVVAGGHRSSPSVSNRGSAWMRAACCSGVSPKRMYHQPETRSARRLMLTGLVDSMCDPSAR